MDHRRLLGLLALAVLASIAGCSAAGSLSMEPAHDPEALAGEASRAVSELDPAPREGERSRRDLVTTAIRNGSTEVTADRPPLDADLPFAFEGAYYALDHRVVDTQQAWRVTIGIDYNGTDPDGRAVEYADLPAVDRATLDALVPQRHVGDTPGMDFGVGAVYTDAELNRSALVGGEYDVLVYEGERFPIRLESPDPVELRTYRYRAERIAANASDYADRLTERYAFQLRGLSEDERSIVREALDSGSYYADSADDRAFASLLRHFRDQPAIERDDTYGTWLVRYDGQRYLVDLHFGGFERNVG